MEEGEEVAGDPVEVVRLLLAKDADPSAVGLRGWTPLMKAASIASVPIVKVPILTSLTWLRFPNLTCTLVDGGGGR